MHGGFGGIPFGAGFGGGFDGPPRSSGPVDTSKLYETLEVNKEASQKEIKKAYFKLSKMHHPDKGGDEHKFKEVSAAYEILSDPEKRSKYDQYGLEGVSDEGGPGGGHDDLFSMFFGGGRGGGGGARSRGPRKGPSLNHPLKCTLEDLYNGKTVKLAIHRKVIVGESSECSKCRGQGAVMEVRQIGPGMITQMQRACPACGGEGHIAKTKNERKVLEVGVEKGMKHNTKIAFRGMADEKPGMEPGDINFVVQELDHDLFKRKGADLLLSKDISLNQALTGLVWKIKHLDGRDVVIKTRPGQVIQADSHEDSNGRSLPFIMVVPNEGMPSLGNPFVKGNLYVMFHITFPDSLDADVVAKLRELLPGGEMPEEYDPEIVEEHYLDVADVRHFGKGGAASHNNEYDSDDEDGQQGVQCQQS